MLAEQIIELVHGQVDDVLLGTGGLEGLQELEDRDLHVEANPGLPGDLLVFTQPHRIVLEGATWIMWLISARGAEN